jgi:hypothetical protein
VRLAKKIALILLAVFVVVQAPFVYRRYKIGQLAGQISQAESQRIARATPGYREYKGVMHVHTSLGGHSTGTFEELIAAANANDLDFVAMTEHYDPRYDTSALTLNGVYGKTLFVNGQEVDTNDGGRYLLLPGTPESPGFAKMDSRAFLEKVHQEGRLAINNYPDRNRSDVTDFDGIEGYSLHINAKQISPFWGIGDILWSLWGHPELAFARHFTRNFYYLERYDAIAAEKRLLLTAGADAHSNKGYYLIADDEGNRHLGFKLDPYEMVFRLVRMHVLLEEGTELTRETLIDALRRGHAFAGFDVLGDTSGFSFSADNGSERRIMGDEIALVGGVKLTAAAPGNARFVLLRNGEEAAAIQGTAEAVFTADRPGTYRVEVYRDELGEPFDRRAPWIMSNPIYIR